MVEVEDSKEKSSRCQPLSRVANAKYSGKRSEPRRKSYSIVPWVKW